jgi:hypothetical protein
MLRFMKALLVAAAVLIGSPAFAGTLYTTTPVRKPAAQVKAENEAEFRRLQQWFQIAPPQPTFDDRMRRIIQEELDKR